MLTQRKGIKRNNFWSLELNYLKQILFFILFEKWNLKENAVKSNWFKNVSLLFRKQILAFINVIRWSKKTDVGNTLCNILRSLIDFRFYDKWRMSDSV